MVQLELSHVDGVRILRLSGTLNQECIDSIQPEFRTAITTATVSPTLAVVRLHSRRADKLRVQLRVKRRLTSIVASSLPIAGLRM